MKYKYSETAGYYGNGGWICYREGFNGISVERVCETEQEAREYCV